MIVRLVVAAALLAAAAPADTASFSVGATAFALPLPADYCLPTGRAAEVLQQTHATDDRNVVDLSLVTCGDDPVAALDNHYVIKTPRSAINSVVTLPELFAVAGGRDAPLIGDKEFAEISRKWQAGGVDAKATGSISVVGHDDVCLYLAGVGIVTGKSGQLRVATGACTTAIGGRLMTIARYRTILEGPDGLDTLMREARAVARSIRVVRAQ